ncbi:citrinin biosynthesis oxidoreductase CtnB [Aulographum hederae CBS 113979]|uniref:Citrinin biosynthesis oxidoreductase CtnB n=1 Tax=Aulographum hederae CBS 113979 TaxID=1176131 RepID=A0A6G1GZK2_9PEZI|nr:citrinin biosynthesis oxidoreductase CtnB [Aulographum hederae CBS 113979]
MASPAPYPPPSTLHLPRLLCLHGGGVTGEIFRLQSRTLLARLTSHFRLVFADGPFFCAAGPGILPVYADHGPYRRWLRWLPEHREIDAESAIDEIQWQLRDAMDEDDRQGATGPWVGLMGFSQGAKVSASLLFEQQTKLSKYGKASTDWKFAVLMAGRAPLVSLSDDSAHLKALVNAAAISEGFETIEVDEGDTRHLLRIPTIHVHGLSDPGIHLHRRMRDQYCEPQSVTLIEWDGIHRVPFKPKDCDPIVQAILEVAKRTGAVQ